MTDAWVPKMTTTHSLTAPITAICPAGYQSGVSGECSWIQYETKFVSLVLYLVATWLFIPTDTSFLFFCFCCFMFFLHLWWCLLGQSSWKQYPWRWRHCLFGRFMWLCLWCHCWKWGRRHGWLCHNHCLCLYCSIGFGQMPIFIISTYSSYSITPLLTHITRLPPLPIHATQPPP